MKPEIKHAEEFLIRNTPIDLPSEDWWKYHPLNVEGPEMAVVRRFFGLPVSIKLARSERKMFMHSECDLTPLDFGTMPTWYNAKDCSISCKSFQDLISFL